MFSRKVKRKDPTEVFTPRQTEVNITMYIHRHELERELKREITGSKHIIIYGESGCGKSWLYRKVLKDLDIKFKTVNLANAERHGSITEEIQNILSSDDYVIKSGYTEKKGAAIQIPVAKGELDHVNSFVIGRKEPLEALLKYMNEFSKNKKSCLVFDNLETIFKNRNIMKELGNLIILLDDERYSKYNVKFLIVGVPAGIHEYFSTTENISTISNRVSELSEISRLDYKQSEQLIKNGFINELKITFNDELLTQYVNHIYWVTNGIPQRLHEYCLELCYCFEDNNWKPAIEILNVADKNWLKKSLSKNYASINNIMNSKGTEVGRKNQVLFVLGQVTGRTFTLQEIENLVREEFPATTTGKTLNTSQVLNNISKSENPPIKKNPKGNEWLFTDQLYLMCLRLMLKKNTNGRVEKLEINEVAT